MLFVVIDINILAHSHMHTPSRKAAFKIKMSFSLLSFKTFTEDWDSKVLSVGTLLAYLLGQAIGQLWDFCAPIFIIVVYCKTATSYFLGGPVLQFYNNRNRCAKVPKWPDCLA